MKDLLVTDKGRQAAVKWAWGVSGAYVLDSCPQKYFYVSMLPCPTIRLTVSYVDIFFHKPVVTSFLYLIGEKHFPVICGIKYQKTRAYLTTVKMSEPTSAK